MSVVALLLVSQSMATLAEPMSEAFPATSWSCNFLDTAGKSFTLSGEFAEAPAGTDPNADLPTVIEGTGPDGLVGRKGFNAFDDLGNARRYQATATAPRGGRFNLSFLFARGIEGLSFITLYTPDPANGRGTLASYATGRCESTFHEKGARGSKK